MVSKWHVSWTIKHQPSSPPRENTEFSPCPCMCASSFQCKTAIKWQKENQKMKGKMFKVRIQQFLTAAESRGSDSDKWNCHGNLHRAPACFNNNSTDIWQQSLSIAGWGDTIYCCVNILSHRQQQGSCSWQTGTHKWVLFFGLMVYS